jgi:tripartite-type tricarboxylate transporter receptor subunit TctC
VGGGGWLGGEATTGGAGGVVGLWRLRSDRGRTHSAFPTGSCMTRRALGGFPYENVEIAEVVANKLVELEPWNTGSCWN